MSSINFRRRIFFIFILFSFILSSSFFVLENLIFGESAKKVAIENAVKKGKERESFFINFMHSVSDTTLAIRNSKQFKNYLLNKKNDIKDLFYAMAEQDRDIMQIRHIDQNGNETIRLDRINFLNEIAFVPEKNLQNKAHRYYFKSSKSKPLEQLWLSALNLNVENKKIDFPYRPTLRAVIPLSQKKQFSGVLVVNYHMADFLKKLFRAPLYDMILINQKGQILKHYDASRNWGNSIEKNDSIQKDFPLSFQTILSKNLVKNENFVSRKLDLKIQDGLILILQFSKGFNTLQKERAFYKNSILFSLILLFSFILSFFLTKTLNNLYEKIFQTKKLNQQLEENNDLLKQSLQELANEKSKYQSILQYATDGIHIIDLEGNLMEWSPSFQEMHGY